MSANKPVSKPRISRAAGAITLCLSPIVGLTACSTYTYPNTCIINETVVDTPIETRNYTVTRNNENRETESHHFQVNFRVFQPKVLRLTCST